LSPTYISIPKAICFRFEAQDDWRAFSLALANTGKRIAARMAMIAMTTNSSISVKPLRDFPIRTVLLKVSPHSALCGSGQASTSIDDRSQREFTSADALKDENPQ